MGIFWRSAMPLLSTLAALVIIVHSAEENLDREYQYDVRPRVFDTETASYEQPWRVMKAEPTMKRTTENVWSEDSHEEPPKRRRKRKRRPIETSDEDLITQERFAYPESPPQVNQDVNYENAYQTTEIPRRRRKRINARTHRWADEAIEAERPIRRRGNRRKRPSIESWPKLSEFPGHFRVEVEQKPTPEEINVKQENTYIKSEEHQDSVDPVRYNGQAPLESQPGLVELNLNEKSGKIQDVEDNEEGNEPPLQENKSLSEFSMEIVPPPSTYGDPNEKVTVEAIKDVEERQNKGQRSIVALKDLLKNSNGSSLIEILQQNNLTLTDLLRGKEDAIMILKSRNTAGRRKDVNTEPSSAVKEETKEPLKFEALESKNIQTPNFQKEIDVKNVTSIDIPQDVRNEEPIHHTTDKQEEPRITEPLKDEIDIVNSNKNKPNGLRYMNRNRFPANMRKKLRMRPMLNNTYKSPLSRDLAALGLKRFPNRRNITKSHEWKSMIPFLEASPLTPHFNNETQLTEKGTELIITTTTLSTTISETADDTTIVLDFDRPSPEVITQVKKQLLIVNDSNVEIPSIELTEATVTTAEPPTTTVHFNVSGTPIVTPILKKLNSSSTRRTAYNNRLKKKRLKHKNSTTEAPQNDVLKNLLELGNSVSSSEFSAKTTVKKEISAANERDVDALEDFMTTAMSRHTESSTRSTKPAVTSVRPMTTTKVIASWRPTEETAEFEIEELLNDTRTSARLSKILMERNMTLNELVEHRERGSSHVHLADIFHNASREPNPPEPFLSKLLIEPISKETYPLRALLDAKHDPAAKATTIDPILATNYIQNIPIVMDFGNNVNENAENMGIMSLFNNFTNSAPTSQTPLYDSEKVPTVTNSVIINTTNGHETSREGRTLIEDQAMVSWNDIFSMIRKGHTNGTDHIETYKNEMTPSATYTKITLEEDVDGDGLIVLEDLQHLRDFDSNIASSSDEKLEVSSYERNGPTKPGVLTMPSNTKSVTVATASIVGLSMVLFLLTYAAFKWIQQKRKDKKRNFQSERIPTPVFENRKGHKNNSSTRSLSPMLSSSNIYTMNTLESQHGKDSPEYMWDTLRKPFQ